MLRTTASKEKSGTPLGSMMLNPATCWCHAGRLPRQEECIRTREPLHHEPPPRSWRPARPVARSESPDHNGVMKFTRGFRGAGQGARPPAPAGPVRHRRRLAGPHRRGDAEARDVGVDVHGRGSGGAAHDLVLGRDPRAPAVDLRGRHPLRDDLVEARGHVRAACRSTRCSTRRGRSRTRRTSSRSRTPATRRTCRSPT